MDKVEYEAHTTLDWISVECPYCDFQHTLFADKENVSSRDCELPEGSEILCSLSELANVYVTKKLECNSCKKEFEIEGEIND